MNDFLSLASAAAAGMLIGAMFFGGLWWTVRAAPMSRHPALWFFTSLILRIGIAMSAFYVVGREHWQPLMACLLGFIAARLIVSRLTQRESVDRTRDKQEAGHAS